MPYYVQIEWDDVPHIPAEEKARLLASIPPHQRDARAKGIPRLGSGAIYPIKEDDLLITPIQNRPEYWSVGYGFDVGWKATAGLLAWHDPQTDCIYLTAEYKRGEQEPAVHAAAIQRWGDWTGAIDPASRGRSQGDGTKLISSYRDAGLNIMAAENAVEAGLFEVYKRMTTGRLKVFDTLVKWLDEFRLYRRDDKGKVVKEHDHLMDCMRYLVMTPSIFRTALPGFRSAPRRVIGQNGVRRL